uniref:Uncharacterized protein n=1 Tax=Rhizophora mucronata TaxID=61149 RepID=A0A2P2IIL0_RHIMU
MMIDRVISWSLLVGC